MGLIPPRNGGACKSLIETRNSTERISYSSRLQVAPSFRVLCSTDTFKHVRYSHFRFCDGH